MPTYRPTTLVPQDLLDSIHSNPSDPIHRCEGVDLSKLLTTEGADELLGLARQKLHVFPFRDVQGCWLRLFTDASIARAMGVMGRGLEGREAGKKECRHERKGGGEREAETRIGW